MTINLHLSDITACRPQQPGSRRGAGRRLPALLLPALILMASLSPLAASRAHAGKLDGLLGSIEKDVNGLLGNPGGILGTVLGEAEGPLSGIIKS
jgi:hypothetical protein